MTEQEYKFRMKDVNVCIDKMFELSVNADKLRAVHDNFEVDAFMDMTKLDETQRACIVEHHDRHNLLFAITSDYLQKVQEGIDDLMDELKAIKDSIEENRAHELKEANK